MRATISALAIALCILIANSDVSASEPDMSVSADISAAKKKKPQRIVQKRGAAPTLAAQRGWFDPSLGPDGKPWPNPYPPGTCSTDMGYGRFSTCDFHE
jgi:hypothetical protein